VLEVVAQGFLVVFVHVCYHTGFESGIIGGIFSHGCRCRCGVGLRRKVWR